MTIIIDEQRAPVHWIFCQFLLLVLLFSFPLNAAEVPTIVLNITGQPPLNTENQNGFQDEVASEALKRVGYKLNVRRLPAERALRSANSGLIDGEMSRINGMEKHYPNLIRVEEKVSNWSFSAFSKKPLNIKTGWQSLNNKEVAIITGWKILEKNVPKSALLTNADNIEQLFFLLLKDRTDIILYETWGGKYYIKKNNLAQIYILEPPIKTKDMYIYLNKKYKELVPILAKALIEMKIDGSYDSLVAKHFLPLTK